VDLFLAICEALGLGLAAGLGGPLAWLFIAVMAGAEAGIDPRGTDWAFVGAGWFIAVLFAANVLAFYQRRRGPLPRRLPDAAGAAALGAIFGAAALAAEGETAAAGFVIGGIAAAAASLLGNDLLSGAQRRVEAGTEASATATLGLILGLSGIVVAVLALFLPPTSLLVALALAALAVGRRRKAGQKYEGLRILR
jgi:hypothetical protein